MRIIAFSDTHRHHDRVHRLFEQTHLTTDLYIFLGDIESDIDNMFALYPDKRILSVPGNCDHASLNPAVGVTEAAGKKIIFTHGHRHLVNFGISQLKSLAEQNGADMVLFGHTHVRYCDYKDGVYFVNPGSLGEPRDSRAPSYAVIDIIPQGILVSHAELQ